MIKWKKSHIRFIRNNYVKTLLTRKEVLEKLNKKFNTDYSNNALSILITEKGLVKEKKYLEELRNSSRKTGREKRYKKQAIFKKRLLKFLKKKQKEGITLREAIDKARIEFENPLKYSMVIRLCSDNKLIFSRPSSKKTDIEVPYKILSNKKLISFIKLKKNLPLWEIESDIIEKFNLRLSSKVIRKIAMLNGIKLKWQH